MRDVLCRLSAWRNHAQVAGIRDTAHDIESRSRTRPASGDMRAGACGSERLLATGRRPVNPVFRLARRRGITVGASLRANAAKRHAADRKLESLGTIHLKVSRGSRFIRRMGIVGNLNVWSSAPRQFGAERVSGRRLMTCKQRLRHYASSFLDNFMKKFGRFRVSVHWSNQNLTEILRSRDTPRRRSFRESLRSQYLGGFLR
jgi:hypothetical protein